MRGDILPTVMLDELVACSRNDCRVTYAKPGVDNSIVSSGALLECAVCHQIWELRSEGGCFSHWDKSGAAHFDLSSHI